MKKSSFFTKIPIFRDIFVPLSFQDEKNFFIHNNFQKVGYYSGFYSSLRDEKRGNGGFVKNKAGFQCILRILGKHEYTCNSEEEIQTITISSFFIAQRAVKTRIIANLLKIIKNTDFFLILKRKGFKSLLESGHFGEKWWFSQTLDA